MPQSTKQQKPNIILVTVDELRYPMHFPDGINDASAFMEKFMPNTYKYIWQDGVKFSNYQTAGCDCSPARGTIITGLYGHQTGLLATRVNPTSANSGWAAQPFLSAVFPTYGKLLKQAGYNTPFIGKWHASNAPNRDTDITADSPDQTKQTIGDADTYLKEYGFDGYSLPDPCGIPGQGVGEMNTHYQKKINDKPVGPVEDMNDTQLNDSQIAAQAVAWLKAYANSGSEQPFCLTVGFLNPHDKQFYWGGTEWEKFEEAYKNIAHQEPYFNYNSTPKLANPNNHGYGAIPANYETQEQINKKPKLQHATQNAFGYFTGGISDAVTGYFTAEGTDMFYKAEKDDTELTERLKVMAPYSYWQRALDMYTQVITDVDVEIGTMLSQIPDSIKKNTIIIFTSDHGDYVSSHGLQGKGQTVYRESYNIPLIVKELYEDKIITNNPEIIRDQLTSSIDLVPMLASLGNGGTMDWITDPQYVKNFSTDLLYGGGKRFDMLSLINQPDAAGRNVAAFTCDEITPNMFNPNAAPWHVIGCVFDNFTYQYNGEDVLLNGKFGFYYNWKQPRESDDTGSSRFMEVDKDSIELEYYNYKDEDSRLELTMDNDEPDSPMDAMKSFVMNELIPQQIHGTLPTEMEDGLIKTMVQYWGVVDLGNKAGDEGDQESRLTMAGHFLS